MADSKRASYVEERGHSGKRKFDEPPAEPTGRPSYKSVPPPLSDFELAKQKAEQIAARLVGDEFKRARTSSDDHHNGPSGSNVHSHGYGHPVEDRAPTDYHVKRMDVPNTKVGLVIGKGGETIRSFQQQSGAKIQVTRDSETDHGSTTRHVELSGTAEQVGRAEQLIRDVIGDAALGPSLGAPIGGPSGEPIQIRVPNNKVGLIIGKGGETIKSLQQNSGARIQVQHDRETEPGATERIVTLNGNKQQIDHATELIKEVIGERSRGGGGGGGGYQQNYRPQQGWGSQSGYGYQQQGYEQQQYGGYGGWEQEQGSYDYYQGQGTEQQTEGEGGYNYAQQGYYYDQQAYEQQYGQQGYDQGQYNQGQQTYNQEQDYAAGYGYEYDQSYYEQAAAAAAAAGYSESDPGAAAAAAAGAPPPPPPPPGEYEQSQQPPASSAQAAHT